MRVKRQRPNRRALVALRREVELRAALSTRMLELAEQAKRGEVTWDILNAEIERISEEHGSVAGIPFPSVVDGKLSEIDHARNGPLAALEDMRPEVAQQFTEAGAKVRNWWRHPGDELICVADEGRGPQAFRLPLAGERMRTMLGSLFTRYGSQISADAELKAMNSLRTRIKDGQWRSYVLNGAFFEKSPRSDIHYLFRKGLPTVAISYHGSESGRVLCCLCLHPVGYHKGTWAGVMTPSDDVIAHLLLMRCDEHKFWKMSGQHTAVDPLSGL